MEYNGKEIIGQIQFITPIRQSMIDKYFTSLIKQIEPKWIFFPRDIIKADMSKSAVYNILGQPTNVQTLRDILNKVSSYSGISENSPSMKDEYWYYRYGDVKIFIEFKSGIVFTVRY